MNVGIKDILIISTPEDIGRIEDLLGDGNYLGINISYKSQPSPDGIAQAFIIGEEFIGDDSVSLILGDNIYQGSEYLRVLFNFENHQRNQWYFLYFCLELLCGILMKTIRSF